MTSSPGNAKKSIMSPLINAKYIWEYLLVTPNMLVHIAMKCNINNYTEDKQIVSTIKQSNCCLVRQSQQLMNETFE